MKDSAGNSLISTATNFPINNQVLTGLKVDSSLDITSVTAPTIGDYVAGQTIQFRVYTATNLNLTGGSSQPAKLQVNVGDKQFYATYDVLQADNDNTLDFTYLVGEGRVGGSPVMREITSLGSNLTLLDANGTNLFLLVDNVPSFANIRVDYSVL